MTYRFFFKLSFVFFLPPTQFLQSSGGDVYLRGLQLVSTGSYRCEVITEAPKFITKFGEGNMTVIGDWLLMIDQHDLFHNFSYDF